MHTGLRTGTLHCGNKGRHAHCFAQGASRTALLGSRARSMQLMLGKDPHVAVVLETMVATCANRAPLELSRQPPTTELTACLGSLSAVLM